MSNFDVSKNGIIREKIVSVESGSIVIGVYSYNGGVPKLGETRVIERNGEQMRAKIGRKTLKEVTTTMPVILEMIEILKEAQKESPPLRDLFK